MRRACGHPAVSLKMCGSAGHRNVAERGRGSHILAIPGRWTNLVTGWSVSTLEEELPSAARFEDTQIEEVV
jgi:hypothetical protein